MIVEYIIGLFSIPLALALGALVFSALSDLIWRDMTMIPKGLIYALLIVWTVTYTSLFVLEHLL